jgi:hypothetical protein
VSTRRVQLDLPEKAVERLQILKTKTEAISYAEVIRNALRLYEAVVEEAEAGSTFQLRLRDGTIKEYLVL